jgi:hypothetical protein
LDLEVPVAGPYDTMKTVAPTKRQNHGGEMERDRNLGPRPKSSFMGGERHRRRFRSAEINTYGK